jgi:hypothetical protein
MLLDNRNRLAYIEMISSIIGIDRVKSVIHFLTPIVEIGVP